MSLSPEYKRLLKKMHSENPKWGREFRDKDIPDLMKEAIETFNPGTILDFGCGKGVLVKKLQALYPNIQVIGWDPHMDSELPPAVDMITSTDVLEHVEPTHITDTLKDLGQRSNICQYHLVACFKAVAILPDGRNAHLTVRTPDWWQEQFDATGMEKYREDSYSYLKDVPNAQPLAVTYYECVLKK